MIISNRAIASAVKILLFVNDRKKPSTKSYPFMLRGEG